MKSYLEKFKIQINEITKITWKRLLLAIMLIVIATALRIWPLESLATSLTWLTFYPAVMLAAVYGGFAIGMIATSLSCSVIIFLWPLIVVQPFIKNAADWLGMTVFFLTSTMISFVAEAMRRANIRARKAQEEAQLANKAKSTFLANMSHELRTPLNAILGYSQMMQRDDKLSLENKEYLQTINRSGEHLLSLINDVLIIAKIESKGVALEEIDFNFHMFINDLQKMFQVQADEKNITLTILGLDDMPKYLYGDEKKLRIIFINLIGNAVKFTTKGGIKISFSSMKSDGQDFMMVVVEDTGVGILAEDLTKLFQYFVQTESGMKSNSGTGLGLAISQEYVKLMGGEILVTSKINKGSSFRFKIKITLGKVSNDCEAQPLSYVIGIKEGLQIPRILIAEDIEENRRLLVKLLSNVGFEVREAVNGEEAVDIFKEWHPHLIWMDIRMPVMDGLMATKLIRESKDGMQVKIIALSAHVLADEVLEILAAGCDDFVGKPYREEEIFDTMAKKLTLEYIYKIIYNEERSSIIVSNVDTTANKERQEALFIELQQSLLELDSIKVIKIIDEIKALDNSIGNYLEKLSKNMQYTQLLYWLKNKNVE